MGLWYVSADVEVGQDLRLPPPLRRRYRTRLNHGVRLPVRNISSQER